jgi:hypothetical protein
MHLNPTENLRQLAKVLLWRANFYAWFLSLTFLWLEHVQHTHSRNFEPPGLTMATFFAALCINIALGFGGQRADLLAERQVLEHEVRTPANQRAKRTPPRSRQRRIMTVRAGTLPLRKRQ